MPRYNFGGSPADFAVTPENNFLVLAPGTTITVWDAPASGSQLVDLLDDVGGVVTDGSLISDSNGQLPRFQGPDGVTRVWIDGGFTSRYILITTDLADIVGEKIGADGGVIAGPLEVQGEFPLNNTMLTDIRESVNVFDVRVYGAVGNAKRRNQASAANSAATTVVVPNAGFSSADIGKTFVVFSSSDVGTIRTISSVTNATTVVLSGAVGLSVNGNARHMAVWGTDDSAAIQAAYTAAEAAVSYNADAQDNLPVVNANPVVRFPAVNEGAYMIAGSVGIDTGHGVATDATGAMLYNCLTSRTDTFITFGRHTIITELCCYLLLGGGLKIGTDSEQCHSYAGLIEVWNPGANIAGVELHGYHHKIEQFWVKALGVGIGIYHNGSSDDYIGHAYMVGPAIGAKLNGCNNVVYNHLRGDTVTTTALLQIDDSRTVNVKGHAFVITNGTLPRVIQIGANSTVVSASINVEMQVTKTGGNLMEIAYCSNSWFRLYASNSDGGAGFGQLVTNGVVYGSGVAAPLTIEQYLPTGVTAWTGTRVGSNIVHTAASTDWNNGQLTLDETNGRLQINGSTETARLGLTTAGTTNHGASFVQTTTSSSTYANLNLNGGLSTNKSIQNFVGAESTARWARLGSGKDEFGDGTNARNVFTSPNATAGTYEITAANGVTANGLPVRPSIARKTSDTVINANVTLASDTDLTLALAASATYLIEGFIIYDSDATADLKIAFTHSSITALNFTSGGAGASGTATTTSGLFSVVSAGATATTVGGSGVGTKMFAAPHGIIRTNAAASLAMQFAQGTSQALNTTVYTDSWLMCTRVA